MLFVVYSKEYLKHDTGLLHPEKPERLEAIVKYLESIKAPVGYVDPVREEKNDFLLKVHTKKHINSIRLHSKTGVGTADTPFRANTFEIAKLSAEGAVKAAEIANKEFAFALIRPPGHHAGPGYFTGFCYFNNIAVAIRKHQAGRRTLVIDIDVHHGNGTQEIFYEDDSVFTFSTHQDPTSFYPYCSGYETENCKSTLNVPFQPGADDEEYLAKFEKYLARVKKEFEPEFIAVSAGFDTWHKDTPIIGNLVRFYYPETYNRIGQMIAALGLPTFAVLEGGYCIPDLGRNVWEFMRAFQK